MAPEHVTPPPLGPKQSLKSTLCLKGLLVPVRPALARGPNPPPVAHHSPLTKQAGRQSHAIEPSHVAGRVHAGPAQSRSPPPPSLRSRARRPRARSSAAPSTSPRFWGSGSSPLPRSPAPVAQRGRPKPVVAHQQLLDPARDKARQPRRLSHRSPLHQQPDNLVVTRQHLVLAAPTAYLQLRHARMIRHRAMDAPASCCCRIISPSAPGEIPSAQVNQPENVSHPDNQ